MSSARRRETRMTIDDVIAWMKTWSDGEKWELVDGTPIAMASGTQAHEVIAMNIALSLNPVRRRGCRN